MSKKKIKSEFQTLREVMVVGRMLIDVYRTGEYDEPAESWDWDICETKEGHEIASGSAATPEEAKEEALAAYRSAFPGVD